MNNDDRRAATIGPGDPVGLLEYAAVLAFFIAFYLLYFSPVLVSGRLLAPGDGAVSYLPAVSRGWSLWIDDLFAGYPAFADTQHFLWYPLRLFGSHYNALVVSAYVIAAFCAYGFARLLSGSMLAGVVAGLIYSGGGFMTAHLGHLSIIHAAAWIPLTLWGLEASTRTRGWPHVAMVAFGVALSFLGGHPQIWVYGLVLAGVYAAWRGITLRDRAGRPDLRYLLRCGVGIAAGIAIASVQLLPFAEFTRLAARGDWTYADYISYSLPPLQLFMAVFPGLFGNVLGGYAPPFGARSLTELAFYAGVVPLILVALAPWSPARRQAWFWIAVAAVAMMYMTADATPLGRFGYQLPVLGSFRCLGRAGIVYTLAVSVLAAHAIAALQRCEFAGARLWRALASVGAIFAAALCILYVVYGSIVAKARAIHVAVPGLLHNKAVWLPVVLFGCGFALCACARRWPRTVPTLLAALVAIDLASFGWFYEWRIRTAAPAPALAPAWQALIADAQRDYARVLPLQRTAAPVIPNLNLLYGLPSASGYVSLIPKRFGDLTGVGVTGVYPNFPPASPFWDLLGVRWILGNASALAAASADPARWRPLAKPLPQYPNALERTDFAGHAWLVGGVVEAGDEDALDYIRSGIMSFGRPFDPRAVALVNPDAAPNLPLRQRWGSAGKVLSQRLSPGRWRLVVNAERPALLVVSQMDYPGWRAAIGGKSVQVLRADYALQAVVVPAGESVVDMSFRPRSVYLGAAASLFGLLVVAICLAQPWLARRRHSRMPKPA